MIPNEAYREIFQDMAEGTGLALHAVKLHVDLSMGRFQWPANLEKEASSCEYTVVT
jgi:hypothetical protein